MAAALADLSRVAYKLAGVPSQLPTWPALCLRLRKPTRSLTGKTAQITKFGLRPFARHVPHLMALRSRLVNRSSAERTVRASAVPAPVCEPESAGWRDLEHPGDGTSPLDSDRRRVS
jgi:hypothetical protein